MQITGELPFSWEIHAIQAMDIYRIDPDYDPAPVKKIEISLIQKLKKIKDAYHKKR